ncbi:uncharacterized protein METZ01_LOCUS108375 [marine metagenome]|uniref:Uncharacterized protein n=1 Tax=marine metagenome TaxID=408172 RepID=A0A381WTB5_9ZZZZ
MIRVIYSASWAGFDTTSALAAVVGLRCVNRQRQVSIEFPQKKPRARLPVD